MNWLWIILIVGVVVGVIAYFTTGNKEDALEAGGMAAFGCGTVVFQIFLAVVGLGLVMALFGWLFGGCS